MIFQLRNLDLLQQLDTNAPRANGLGVKDLVLVINWCLQIGVNQGTYTYDEKKVAVSA
jgi:hypothetical protein